MPSLEFRRVLDRKSTRLNSSHTIISYAVFCMKKVRATSTISREVRRPRLARGRHIRARTRHAGHDSAPRPEQGLACEAELRPHFFNKGGATQRLHPPPPPAPHPL